MGKRRDTSQEGAAALDVRLTPDDRTTAPADARKRKAAEAREGAGTDERRARRAARSDTAAPRKPKAGGGSGRDMKRKGFGFGRLIYWGVVFSIWGVIALAGVFGWVALHLPPIQSLEIPKRPPTIQINTVDGRIFATRGEMGGAAIPLKDMPAHLPNAFIAIEDRRFYHHHGVDPIGLIRAVLANVLHRGISQGGSTITQQLAKNLFLTPERHLMRKLQEVVLALWLEHKFTKAEILELYLNRVYFGSGAYGVEAAAQRYFGKIGARTSRSPRRRCSRASSNHRRASPPTRNFDAAERRGQIVLAAMSDAGLIKEDAAKAAMAVRAHDRQAERRRLLELRRRLGDGRAQRPRRPRRRGHRGRHHHRRRRSRPRPKRR